MERLAGLAKPKSRTKKKQKKKKRMVGKPYQLHFSEHAGKGELCTHKRKKKGGGKGKSRTKDVRVFFFLRCLLSIPGLSKLFFLPPKKWANFDDLRPLQEKFGTFEHLWGLKRERVFVYVRVHANP